MIEQTFTPGDFVELLMQDGVSFHGYLVDITAHYVLLEGKGFASGDIRVMHHA